MSTYANTVIDALGGTTAVARMADLPTSTVHSWRTIGIPRSRLSHLRLLAKMEKIELPMEPSA
ncbi:MAG: carph-isopro domain-containing protein [Beijerinckiaceae bacterium]